MLVMDKKPYSPPTVTELGDAVEKTKGVSGRNWEFWGTMWGSPPPPPDDTKN
jgi:hypothetical protein